ncbi:hypothetical protein [Azospirillum oryzae]|nr:hypothetical protein [Azospirillum oryzae]
MREKSDRRRHAGEVIAQGGAVEAQLQDLEDAAADRPGRYWPA